MIVIVGPTSSGKSELAVQLAKKFHGEIISADSRQIYKGMDLGTGKVTGKWQDVPFASHPERSEGSHHPERACLSGRQVHPSEGSLKQKVYVYKSIPHHLIDFQNPTRQYSASRFQALARKKIAEIINRGNLPIICGGTAHWIDAVVYNQTLPEVKPNAKLRAKLEKQSAEALFKRLIKLDPIRASNIDKFNKRRLIRALEIVITTGRPVPIFKSLNLQSLNYCTLWLGINLPQKTLYQKIDARLNQRLKAGMVNEVAQLHLGSPSPLARGDGPNASEGQRGRKGLSWKKLESFGLEYKFISLFLQKKISREELVTQLSFAIKHYSKRQMTWWKKNPEIIWIKPNVNKAVKLTAKFLKS